jgi:hypothetical protein
MLSYSLSGTPAPHTVANCAGKIRRALFHSNPIFPAGEKTTGRPVMAALCIDR